MKNLSDWTFYEEDGDYPAWYRFLTEKKEVSEGLEITFKNGYPIIAAIFCQGNGSFICACNSNDPEVLYGELDQLYVEDGEIEIIMLTMDIKLHGYGYKVVPGKKAQENGYNY